MSVNNEVAALKNKIIKLEKLINKLLSAHQQFVSNLQAQELTGIIEINLSEMQNEIAGIKTRLAVLEEFPDID